MAGTWCQAAQPGGSMATTQDDGFAELQRANAELRRERDAALAQRSSEDGATPYARSIGNTRVSGGCRGGETAVVALYCREPKSGSAHAPVPATRGQGSRRRGGEDPGGRLRAVFRGPVGGVGDAGRRTAPRLRE